MLLLRTICTTDWKGRPTHRVVLVAKPETPEAALEAMNADVAEWMASDIASDEYCERAEQDLPIAADFEATRTEEILTTDTPAEIKGVWEITNQRWEMDTEPGRHREFVYDLGNGDLTTVVYHILNDDFSPREAD